MEMSSTSATGADKRGVLYTLEFAAVLSVVAATLVSSAFVLLRDRQQANKVLALQTSVLLAAGLIVER